MNALIGMDIGTTGVKSIIMDEKGRILASDFQEYPLDLPRPGWAEQHPESWWQAACHSLRSLVQKSKIKKQSIRAISFSGQMHGLVCLDKNLRVIRPAILWCDQRTTAQCRSLTKKIGRARLIRLVCNPALEGFTLPKLLWVREREPKNYARIFKILLPKDYVRFRLTGELGMEMSDAAGTLMLDVARRRWSRQLLEKLDIPPDFLPPLYESIDVAGTVTRDAAAQCGLPEGTPVVFGGADNTCAAIGNGIIEQGLVGVSIGTSGTVVAPTRKVVRDPHGRMHTFNHSVPQLWYLMGVMQAAGGSLRWFRDNFAHAETLAERQTGVDAYQTLCAAAARIPPGSEGLLWLPYLQGERTPHLNANARGVLFGLTTRHTRAHVIRAILEGVAFGLRDSLEIMRELRVPIRQIRLTGGGARSPLWRQILADIFNHEVVTINITEGPPFGAALIAGVGVGVYKSFREATRTIIRVTQRIQPIAENVRLYDRTYPLFRRLYRSLKRDFDAVIRLQG